MDHIHPNNDLVQDVILRIAEQKKIPAEKIALKLAQQQPKMLRCFWSELDEYRPSNDFEGIFRCYECGEFSLETNDPIKMDDGSYQFSYPL